MTRKSAPRRTTTDASGPLVAVCQGHRCAGLRRMTGTAEQAEDLQEVVRSTAGAVLISSPCLGGARWSHWSPSHDGTDPAGAWAPPCG